jgi:hypothetical protein
MEIDGKITILINQDYTDIEIYDENSSITFIKIKLTPEELSSALSRLAYTPCKVEIIGLEKIGKKMIVKDFAFQIPQELMDKYKNTYNIPENELWNDAQILLDKEGDGYTPDRYFRSQGTFFKKDGVDCVRVLARKWI